MNDAEIVALARQSQRWLYAAGQDGDLVVKHLHLNYGVGDLDLLAETASPERIRTLTGLDIAVARENARAEQDRVQRELITRLQQCQTQPAPSGTAPNSRDTLHPMFDVVRLGQTDLDLLPWLRERDEIQEGYVRLEMQPDPVAPTTLSLHVLGPNEPGYYEGRDAVVRKLIAMWHRRSGEGPLPSRLDNFMRGYNEGAARATRLVADRLLIATPGNFGARMHGSDLRVPVNIADYFNGQNIRNAVEMVSWLHAFPDSAARGLGWALEDVLAARAALVSQLRGMIPESILSPSTPRDYAFGALIPCLADRPLCPPGTGLRISMMMDGTCTEDCVPPVALLNGRSIGVDIPLPPVRPSGQATPADSSNGWLGPLVAILGVSAALSAAFYLLLVTAREGESSDPFDFRHADKCHRWLAQSYPQKRAALELFFAARIESGFPMEQSIEEAISYADQRCVSVIQAERQ
jgi:hypothetical protein